MAVVGDVSIAQLLVERGGGRGGEREREADRQETD